MSVTLSYFQAISKIPRPSKKEGKIRDFLISWAKERNFEYKTDEIGNVVIFVPATADKTKCETYVLQAHMDMVCVKDANVTHDFEKDPIEIIEKEGWLHANGTTLGADNGIGMALALASVDFPSHPAMELLFTVDEEQGMSWVEHLNGSLLAGKKLINLDSEEEAEICVSSAGGVRIQVIQTFTKRAAKYPIYEVRIWWLQGGHSWVDIHLNRGSAFECLFQAIATYAWGVEVASIQGGVAMNAIPLEVLAILSIEEKDAFEKHLSEEVQKYQHNHDCPDIFYTMESSLFSEWILVDFSEFMRVFSEFPNGVMKMSEKIPDLVQTSVNVGIITTEDAQVSVCYFPRSSVQSELDELYQNITKKYTALGAQAEASEGFAGWQQDPNSSFVQGMQKIMESTFEKPVKITAIHAGLECGAIVAKMWSSWEAVSIGPNVQNPHTTSERCEIASVLKVEKFLQEFLASV